jgi:hypothetical protein
MHSQLSSAVVLSLVIGAVDANEFGSQPTAPSGGFLGALKTMADSLGSALSGHGDSAVNQQAAQHLRHGIIQGNAYPAGTYPRPGAGLVADDKERTRLIQQGLSNLGYSPGVADGIAGKNTRRAIFDFQLDNGMQADGEPSLAVLQAIQARAGGRPVPATRAVRPAPRHAPRTTEACIAEVNRLSGGDPRRQITTSQYAQVASLWNSQQGVATSESASQIGLLSSIALAPFTGGASLLAGGALVGMNSGAPAQTAAATNLLLTPAQAEVLDRCLDGRY